MTAAVNTLRDGHTFQARQFWRRAIYLFDEDGPLERVGFECGPKGFDDIWVQYKPGRNAHGLHRQHYQCKWHVASGVFGHVDLTKPEFINAVAVSWLQRARDAHDALPPGAKSEFSLLTNWTPDPADPLKKLVHMRDGRLRLDDLFAGKTTNSEMGKVREAWRTHLGIDDAALRELVARLSFGFTIEPLSTWRELLDRNMKAVGLRVDPSQLPSTWYDDLVFQWLAQGRQEFDRTSLMQLCEQNGLFDQPKPPKRFFGIKSFEHPIDKLEERCVATLNLTPSFKERQIRSADEWGTQLYPQLVDFVRDAARRSDPLSLAFDAHATLAFAAGAALTLKSGRAIEVEQRVLDRQLWSADDAPRDPNWTKWVFEQEVGKEEGDLLVAVSLTHDVAPAVGDHMGKAAITGSRLYASIESGPGNTSVKCGAHAFELAHTLAQKIAELRRPGARIHLFVAGPNVFTFFLGQHLQLMGEVSLYEFDFGGSRGYERSLDFPVEKSAGMG